MAEFRAGRTPVPIAPGTKGPNLPDWQNLRYPTEQDVRRIFGLYRDGCNVGRIIRDGPVDVDLDCPEAVRAGSLLLPATPSRHGRPGALDSHHWFRVADPSGRSVRLKDPDGSILVELREGGAQTLIPPSIHPGTRRPYVWSGADDAPPAEVDRLDLVARVHAVALVAVLTRAGRWPGPGGRNDAYLALAGGLLRGGHAHPDTVKLTEEIVRAVAAVTDDEQADRRVAETVVPTVDKLGQGANVVGWTTLAGLLGEGGGRVVGQAARFAGRLRDALGCPYPDREADRDRGGDGEERRRQLRLGNPSLDLAALVDPARPARRYFWEGMVPEGEQGSIIAPPGEGKSLLVLALCVAAALGERAFLGRALRRPNRILYLDLENSEDDLAERLVDLGVSPQTVAALSERLTVLHMPDLLGGLDTERGGVRLLELLDAYGVGAGDLLVLDSTQRVTSGEENSNDTPRALYRYTTAALKRLRITTIRTDNMGWSRQRERGASGRRDDVGAAWLLTADEKLPDVYTLENAKRRARPRPGSARRRVQDDRLTFHRVSDPVTGALSWEPARGSTLGDLMAELRALLDDLGVPKDAGLRAAWDAVRAHYGQDRPKNVTARRVEDAQRERQTSLLEFISNLDPADEVEYGPQDSDPDGPGEMGDE